MGWVADFFRFVWSLLYWNTRKSWFQWRKGRARCPCQSPSDSGRAYETGCDACVTWAKPARFRRVCPLLVDTPNGLRCSANTAEVRPFWAIAAKYYGGAALALYLMGAVTVFIFLRIVGYPISIVHVTLPPLWHKVGQARAWYFHERAQQAFNAGKTNEGFLYLANSYQFDPSNYAAGLRLAKYHQAGQPARSDEVYAQLMEDHADKRSATAQEWFRALLARGNFNGIAKLAHGEITRDPARAPVWVRALIFAVRQGADDVMLRDLFASKAPLAAVWHRIFEIELLLRAGKNNEARAALERPWPRNGPRYNTIYRVTTLIQLKAPLVGLDLLEQNSAVLAGEDAYITLKLDALAAAGATAAHRRNIDAILASRLNLPTVTALCAHLIRYPNEEIFTQLSDKAEREALPLNEESAGAWFSLFCAAGVVDERARLRQLSLKLRGDSTTPFVAPGLLEAFFRGETVERRITSFLPFLPLPIDVTYALLDRYPPARAAATKR